MRSFIAVLLLFSLLSSSWAVDVPDGYSLVPTEEMRSWLLELQAGRASVRALGQDLETSENDIADLRQSVSDWIRDSGIWEAKYRDLLTESESWTADYQTLNRDFQQLEVDYQELMDRLKPLLKELNSISKKLTRTRWIAGTAIVAVILETVALILTGRSK